MTIFTWNTANFKWNENPYLWNEVVLILEIADGDGDTSRQGVKKKVEKLDRKKKKRLIHLIMRRKGIKLYDESKEVKEISTKVDDVKLIISEVNKTKITMEMNHV